MQVLPCMPSAVHVRLDGVQKEFLLPLPCAAADTLNVKYDNLPRLQCPQRRHGR